MKNLRHGDLVFTAITKFPKRKKVKENKSHILAHGEHTGHFHQLTADKPIKLFQVEDTTYFELQSHGQLTHQEHHTIEFPPGKYKMHFEREYDYFLQEVRNVID